MYIKVVELVSNLFIQQLYEKVNKQEWNATNKILMNVIFFMKLEVGAIQKKTPQTVVNQTTHIKNQKNIFTYTSELQTKTLIFNFSFQVSRGEGPQGHMVQWIKVLVRSSDMPKEWEFNTQWRQWRTFRGEINRR